MDDVVVSTNVQILVVLQSLELEFLDSGSGTSSTSTTSVTLSQSSASTVLGSVVVLSSGGSTLGYVKDTSPQSPLLSEYKREELHSTDCC